LPIAEKIIGRTVAPSKRPQSGSFVTRWKL